MKENVFNEIVVVKRSGQRVSFNGDKIALAIKKGFDSVYENYDEKNVNKIYENVLLYIKENYNGRKTINVEDIQDIIENILKKYKFNEVFASFNKYRERRAISREIYEEKREHKFVKSIEKIGASYNEIMNECPMNILLNLGKTISSEYSKSYVVESKYEKAHEEGKIYIHNLEYLPLGTIDSIHLDLSNIVLESKQNYLDDILNIVINSKKEISGEISLSSFDYVLQPYVLNHFKYLFKEILISYLKLEGLLDYININKLDEDINKIDNIELNLKIFEKYILNQKINYIFETAYNDSYNKLRILFQNNLERFLKNLNEDICFSNRSPFSISFGTNKEGTFINEILLNVLNEMDRLNNVYFIYKLNKHLNIKVDDKYFYLTSNVIKLITKNKNISLSNINASFNKRKEENYKYEIEYFSNGKRIFDNIYKDKELSIGRMILGKATLNLTLLALKSKNIKDFYTNLKEILDLIKNQLLNEFEFKCNKSKENFKYLFNSNTIIDESKLEYGQRLRKVLKHGTLMIEISGLYECLNSLNKKDFTLEDINLMYDILNFIKKKCDEYTNETKLNFTFGETLDINIKEKLLSIDKSIYGNLKNITDKKYYEDLETIFNLENLKERLKYESKIQKILNGGYLIRINKKCNNKEILDIINYMVEFDIGYITFNKKEMLL